MAVATAMTPPCLLALLILQVCLRAVIAAQAELRASHQQQQERVGEMEIEERTRTKLFAARFLRIVFPRSLFFAVPDGERWMPLKRFSFPSLPFFPLPDSFCVDLCHLLPSLLLLLSLFPSVCLFWVLGES